LFAFDINSTYADRLIIYILVYQVEAIGLKHEANSSYLTLRFRLMGLLPLAFFIAHTLYYLEHGGLAHMLWMCNIANLVLAAGLLLNRPLLIRLAVIWLIPGLPLWFWFVVREGGWLLTSFLGHVGGLIVGVIALLKVRAARGMWLYALAWYLLIQQLCRLFTPADLNVNVAHSVYQGWESVISSYWQYWIITTLMVAAGLWLIEIILLKLLPPRSPA
jgi:hypothetical protein